MERLIRGSSPLIVRVAPFLFAVILILSGSITSRAQLACTYGWGTITVTNPTAGQQYDLNTTMTVRWSSNRYTIGQYGGTYRVEYSSNDGVTWFIAGNNLNGYQFTYNWLIPGTLTPTTTYRIRVGEVPGPSWGCAFSTAGTSARFEIQRGCRAATITAPPASISRCTGTAATFTVISNMTAGTYEWRRNAATLAVTTSNTYTIPSVTLADGGIYDVILRDNCDPVATVITSASALLTVIEAPRITVQMPATRVICENANDTLRITAVGAALTYQWRQNGVNIAGATMSSLVINNANATHDGSYDCIVSGTCAPAVTSTVCAVSVALRPRITVAPTPQDVCPGTTATLSVTATGTNLVYQWFRNDVIVPNGFNSTLTIPNYNYASNGQYHVSITSNVFNPNNCNVVASSAKVRVTGFRPPTIKTSPTSMDACVGTTATFVAEAEGSGLTYEWLKDGVVIPNASSNSLTIPVTVASGGTYVARVTGTCTLTANTENAVLTAISKPKLTVSPVSQQLTVGDKLTLTVAATDSRTIQWHKNDMAIPGATGATFTINSANKADAGYYNALIRNACGGVSSAYATISVLDPLVPEPVLELAQTTVDFGAIPFGYDKSITLNGLIKNVGTAPLNVTSVAVGPSEYTITNAPAVPFTLAPNASQGITVKATPSNIGILNGVLTVQSNSPSNPIGNVTLTANYVRRYSFTDAQDFDSVDIAETKAICTSITNNSAIDITIEQISVTGANAAQFTVTTALPLAIAAGQSADVCITFAPGTVGIKTATLNVRSSTGGNSSIAVRGVGTTTTGIVDAAEAGITASPNPMSDFVEIRFAKATPAMTISVISSAGSTVSTFTNDAVQMGESVRWNGRDNAGASLASGTYTLLIRTGSVATSLPIVIVR